MRASTLRPGATSAVDRRRGLLAVVAILALVVVSLRAEPAVAGNGDVVITSAGPEPAEVTAAAGERVTFVNRTGRLVHLEFEGEPAGHRVEHRVFQVPSEIWAVFHRTGRHPYVVHGWSGTQVLFRGGVNVEGRRDEPAPGTCTGISVMEVCLEP